MKKIFLLIVVCVIGLNADAHDDSYSMLRLRLSDGSLIAVNVNGRYFNKGTTSLTLDGLRPGLHRIDVYRVSSTRGRHVRIYSGDVRLRQATEHVGVIDVSRRSMRLYAQALVEDNRDDYSGDSRSNHPGERYDDDHDHSRSIPQQENNDNVDSRRRQPEGTSNGQDARQDGYGSYPHGRGEGTQPGGSFSQRDMDDLRTRVDARNTDTDKESLMKKAIGSHRVTSGQVRRMLDWLAFESTKLDFAKWAYSHVSDPKNYRRLEDSFTFSSSKKEFNEAINGR